jgi:hypothetical protein
MKRIFARLTRARVQMGCIAAQLRELKVAIRFIIREGARAPGKGVQDGRGRPNKKGMVFGEGVEGIDPGTELPNKAWMFSNAMKERYGKRVGLDTE